jgi:hypothetical protein
MSNVPMVDSPFRRSRRSPIDFSLSADLSAELGKTLTLSLDLSNEDDGNRSLFDPTNFSTGSLSGSKVPEPHSLALVGLGALMSLLFLRTGATTRPFWTVFGFVS